MTVGIEMGTAADGTAGVVDLEELLATRLLVQGNSGSGKSHLLRRLLEQSAPHVQQVVIDPEGDFVTLAERFGHVVVEGGHGDADLRRIAARVREHRVSVVLSLEDVEVDAQVRAAAAFLTGLFEVEREFWYPVLVVVDEAQLFAPSAAADVGEDSRKASLAAMTNLMCRGRKRGLAGVIATQRLAKLAKNVAAEASNFLMGRTFLDIDMARAADLLGLDRRGAEGFRDLQRGQFVALGPALARRPLSLRIGPVQTRPRSGSPVLLPLPEPADDALRRSLVAPSPLDPAPPRPRRAPAQSTGTVLEQLAQHRPAEPAEALPAMSDEAREEALVLILQEIGADPDASRQPLPVLYQDFLARCRIRRMTGAPLDLAAFRRRLAFARAGFDGAEGGKGRLGEGRWGEVVAATAAMPEEVQGLYLVLARAALDGAPCPGDEALAEAIGSLSPGRARRLLAYAEARGHVVCRTDFRGGRIVALPALGCETASGAPKERVGGLRRPLEARVPAP